MNKDAQMIAQLHLLFPRRAVKECLTFSNREKFHIVENELTQKCVIKDESTNSFRIINPTQKNIHLLVIDNCFFTSQDTQKRCDCIVFDDRYFCFIELKLDLSKTKQISERRKEARDQLGATIEFFRSTVNSKFLDLKPEAYIVLPIREVHPKHSASRSEVAVAFLEKYGVPLLEKAEKDFSEPTPGN